MSPTKLKSLPEERYPIPRSLEMLFQKKALNEKHLWIIGTLTRHILTQDRDSVNYAPNSYKPLYSGILRQILTSRYGEVLRVLKEKNLIEIELNSKGLETYDKIRGVSKKYRLNGPLRTEVLEDQLTTLPIQKSTLLNKIDQTLIDAQKKVYEAHSWAREELKALNNLRWDEPAARKWLRMVLKSGEINGEKISNKQLINLEDNIHSITKLFSRSKLTARISVEGGRLFHILTYCKRELRGFVTNAEGQPLVEIDMKSAQWLLLSYCMALAAKHGYKKDLKGQLLKHVGESVHLLNSFPKHSSARAFAATLVSLDIYQELAVLSKSNFYTSTNLNNISTEERERVKQSLLRHVLYGYQTGKMKDVFKDIPPHEKSLLEVFYETYDDVVFFCKNIADDCKKKKLNGQLSRSGCLSELLLTMESDFFHDKLRKALESRYLGAAGYFIVHDAIYVDPKLETEVCAILNQLAFIQFGIDDYFSR